MGTHSDTLRSIVAETTAEINQWLGAVRQTGTAVTKTAVKNNSEGSDGQVPAVTPVDSRRRVQSWDMINAIREIPEELMGVQWWKEIQARKGMRPKLAILGTFESILADLYWRPVNSCQPVDGLPVAVRQRVTFRPLTDGSRPVRPARQPVTLDGRLRALYPILTLPPEITSEIFLYSPPTFYSNPERNSANPREASMLLCYVCTTWREVTLSTPALYILYIPVWEQPPKYHDIDVASFSGNKADRDRDRCPKRQRGLSQFLNSGNDYDPDNNN
ncbi:hypothetical protein B0H17DRAFT_1187451 [Mycena rosella]|uniref:F-box domain-containing protein n=1 Tax=Mycena rosella TaxID=1033263 RepID=A0AAD7C2L4_MYCRO|nr:hypothetical protein B0H17DRAFT_1187451 [Mycena rosella]